MVVGVLLLATEPAAGGRLTDFTQAELHSLPRLCLAQQFINEELDSPVVSEAERKEVRERLGHSFVHYHHYCWALLCLRRAEAPGGDKFNYHRAVDNLDYVIRNADPTFALLPQVYFQKGEVLARRGDREAAGREYETALRVQPDYTPARAALVQLYIERGDLEAAQAELTKGLQHDPGSTILAEKKAALAALR